MHDIACRVEAIEVVPHAAVPTLAFRLRILDKSSATAGDCVAGIGLQCQILIEAPRRRHSAEEKEQLVELFGDLNRPENPLRTLLWTHASVNVPAFESECTVDLPVPCSFDFNVAATKYFHSLQAGEVPLSLQFSGTVFFRDEEGRLQIGRIPWSSEAQCALPVATWKDLRDRYYPNTAWLCLHRAVFERLCEYKRRSGLPSWEHAVESLLDSARSVDRQQLEPLAEEAR